MKKIFGGERGFTLVETLVSVSLFALAMVTVLEVVIQFGNVHKKSLSGRTALDSAAFTIESMSRVIMLGSNYHCSAVSDTGKTIADPKDCGAGAFSDFMAFEAQGGNINSTTDQVIYCLDVTAKQILRSSMGTSAGSCQVSNQNFVPVSPSSLEITDLKFFVGGTAPTDQFQPRVTIIVFGKTKLLKSELNASFTFQTTVSQRILDL